VATGPDGTRAYVTINEGGLLSVVDTATNSVVADIAVGVGASVVALTPDGTRAYVTVQPADTVSVIGTATNTVTATIPLPGGRTAWPSPRTGHAPTSHLSRRTRSA